MANILDNVVKNLTDKINSLSSTATPADLAYLAKSAEAIGGRTTVMDLLAVSSAQQDVVTALATQKTNDLASQTAASLKSVNDNAAQKTTDFNTNAAQKTTDFNTNAASLSAIANAGKSLAQAHQADLTLRKYYTTNAAITLSATDLSTIIELDCARSLDWTSLDLALPDATTIWSIFLNKEIVIKNRSLAKINIKPSGSASPIMTIQPYAWARLVLVNQTNATGLWRVASMTMPAIRDRLNNFGYSSGQFGEFLGPNGVNLFGGSSYGSFNTIIPCMDLTGQKLAGSAMLSFTYDTSYAYTTLALAPLVSDADLVWTKAFANYLGNSGQYSIANAMPMRGGLIVFGRCLASNYFEINYFSAPNFNTRVVVEGGALTYTTYYNATAHSFADGQYLVVVFSNQTNQLNLLKRYKINADGTISQAGSIPLSTSASYVAQLDDTYMAVQNGTSFAIYDMTSSSLTLSPALTPIAPFSSAQVNQMIIPVGRGSLIACDGIYQWNGSSLSKMAGTSGLAFTQSFDQPYVVNFIDGFSQLIHSFGPSSATKLFYFTDSGAFSSRDPKRFVGTNNGYGYSDARLWPLSQDCVLAINGYAYTYSSSYAGAISTITTELVRVAPGNIGVTDMGGK